MKISMIIPCYNIDPHHFEECLISIRDQEFKDFELIVIDDGSDDKHSASTKELTQKIIPEAQYYFQNNMGVSSARNNALKYANGEYVCFVDADDILLPFFLKESYSIAEKYDADFVIGGNCIMNQKSPKHFNKIKTYELTSKQKKSYKKHMIGDLKHWGDFGAYIGRGPTSRLLRREIALDTPFPSHLKMAEDIIWNLDLLEKCNRIIVAQQVWYLYRINPLSVNRKPNINAIKYAADGLFAIRNHIDLSSKEEFGSYCKRIFQEQKRIYCMYHSNSGDTAVNSQIKCIKRRLKNDLPWNEVGTIKAFKAVDFKTKIKCLLYRFNLLFLVYGFMSKL